MERWRPAAPHAIDWREWDDELVVYNDVTGSTHHLSVFGSMVLRALLEHASGVDMTSLVRDVESRVQSEASASLESEVAGALAELVRLQLAERSSS